MSQLNFITENRKGKHLTYEERIKLETLYKMGLNSSHIAEQLGGHSERTIRPAYNNTKGTSISERPAAVASRDEIGHW